MRHAKRSIVFSLRANSAGWLERILALVLGEETSLFLTGRGLRGGTRRPPRT
jgi:hypothetical protein